MKSKQLKIGALLSYVSIAVNIVVGLLYTPWMVAQIGQGDYGLYTLANSLITLFLVDFGLGAATSRYVSQYRAEGRQDKIDNFLGAIYKLYLLIDAIIFIILIVVFFLIDTIYVKLTPEEIAKFKVVYLIAASFSVLNFPFVTFNGILNAYEEFIPLKLADVIYRFALVGVTVLALLLGYGVYALVAIHAIVGLAIVAYKFIVIKRKTPINVNFAYRQRSLYKEIFSFSVWMTVSLLAQRLVFSITPSILGATASSAAIAVFGVISTIEGYTYTITTAINGMFMTEISRRYETQNSEESIMPLFVGVGKFQYALNGLIVVGFAVVGKSFIQLWMGSDYLDAYWGILLVTIPGLFFNSLQIANTSMIVKNKVNLQAYVNVATGLLNVALSIFLSSWLGVIGACLSIFAAYTMRAVVMHIISGKVLRFDMVCFIKKCYVRLGISLIGTLGAGFLINYLIPDGGWMTFFMKTMLVTVIYLILVFFTGLEKQERDKVKLFIGSKLKTKS